jgi:histidinol dehydrogenase
MKIPIIKATANSPEVMRICSRPAAQNAEIEKLVKEILFDIKKNGLNAAIAYSKKYDGLKKSDLRISGTEIRGAAAKIDFRLKAALKRAIENVKVFHKKQIEAS